MTRMVNEEEYDYIVQHLGSRFYLKNCFHYCCMSSVPQCCKCADKRPVTQGYLGYTDGVGDQVCVGHRSRRVGYCPRCRDETLAAPVWHPTTHMLFPVEFRRAVKTILMGAHRGSSWTRVPPELLLIIFSMVPGSSPRQEDRPPKDPHKLLRLSVVAAPRFSLLYRLLRPHAVAVRSVLMVTREQLRIAKSKT